MKSLKINLRILVLPLLALLFLALPTTQASAHQTSFDLRSTELMESNLKIKIIIIIIIKKKKKGVVEATGIKLGTKETEPAANQVLAEASVADGMLSLNVLGFNIGMPPTVMLIPDGFIIPKQAALKMGYKAGAFKVKGGRLPLKANSIVILELEDD